MPDTTVRGRFVWHELWTPNPAGAHEFYSQTVGWRAQAWQHDRSYSQFVGPSGPLGAAVERRTGAPLWIPYVGTTDVDATVETATRLGARVQTAATTVPKAGRHAVLVDPQGATFGIHASSGEPAPETAAQPGEFSWHELATSVAPDAAFPFYAALFGWDELSRFDMGPMGMYLIFGRNGTQLGGMFDKGAAGKPGAAYWLAYVRVNDLDAAIERAKAARGSVLTGPMDVPGGDRIAQLMDPHGAFFALHVLAAEAAATARSAKAPRPTAARAAPRAAANKVAKKKPAKRRPAKKPARKAAKARPGKTNKKKRAVAKKAASKPKKKRRR